MRLSRLLPRSIRKRIDMLDRLDAWAASSKLDQVRDSLGRIEARQLEERRGSLHAHEFQVYSQSGEDGIVQYLTSTVPVPRRTFVEFGVEDYVESNTRFLLRSQHWSGLVIDGDASNIARIRSHPDYMSEDLMAVQSFVTRENINQILEAAGLEGPVGLLSVDIDGNDYWVFDAIEQISPAIAIVEYNHRFGSSRSVTIPYNPGFVRRQTDSSWLFPGASLKALSQAASRKGMSLVGCNSFGNNAFFVRTDLMPSWLAALTPEEAFVSGRFREGLIVDGQLVIPSPQEEQSLLASVDLVEV
jgi:hypothetical protein